VYNYFLNPLTAGSNSVVPKLGSPFQSSFSKSLNVKVSNNAPVDITIYLACLEWVVEQLDKHYLDYLIKIDPTINIKEEENIFKNSILKA